MTLVRIVTGSESLSHGTSGLLVHVVSSNGLQTPGKKPMFVSDAAKVKLGGIRLPAGRTLFIPASSSGLREQGQWFDGNFDIPDGTVLRLSGRRHERVGGRTGPLRPLQRCAMYIRIREDAALRRLTLNTISDNQSADVPVVIEGRFDILSLREAGQAGVAIVNEDLMLTKVDAVRGVLVHEQLAAQTQAPVRVQRETVKVDNEDVVVQTARRPRAINLGD